MKTNQVALEIYSHHRGYVIEAHPQIRDVVFKVAMDGKDGQQIGIFEVIVPITEVALFWDNHGMCDIPSVVWRDGTRSWATPYTMLNADRTRNRPHHISTLSGQTLVEVMKFPS